MLIVLLIEILDKNYHVSTPLVKTNEIMCDFAEILHLGAKC